MPRLREDKRDMESAGQYRKYLQQRLLGVGRWQQQPVARTAANNSADSYREILRRSLSSKALRRPAFGRQRIAQFCERAILDPWRRGKWG